MVVIEVFPLFKAKSEKELLSKCNFDTVQTIQKKVPESEDPGLYEKSLDSTYESDKMGSVDTPILSDAPNLYKLSSGGVSERFIKLNECEATYWLMANHPVAYLLLNLIALRAQRKSNHPSGLCVGEAFTGDYESIGSTRQQYRTALEVLTRLKYIAIVETCRTRKKSTTGTATKGTKVKLLSSEIWDINLETCNHRINHRPTTDQPPTNHEQEELSLSKVSNSTMSPSQAQSTKVKERIFFDWESKRLEGIENSDLNGWTEAFPHVNVPEYLKFIEQDIAAKPTKYSRRKQIVRTVLIYFKNKNENEARRKENHKKYPYAKPEPKYNRDQTPSNPKKSISFAEDI